jgi:hypothetical protein
MIGPFPTILKNDGFPVPKSLPGAFLMDGLEGSQQRLLVRASHFEFDDLGVGKKKYDCPKVMVIRT